jgi:hypothetical protein
MRVNNTSKTIIKKDICSTRKSNCRRLNFSDDILKKWFFFNVKNTFEQKLKKNIKSFNSKILPMVETMSSNMAPLSI